MIEDFPIYVLIFLTVDGELVLATFDNKQAAQESYDKVSRVTPTLDGKIECTINTQLVSIPKDRLSKVLYVKEFLLRSEACLVIPEEAPEELQHIHYE